MVRSRLAERPAAVAERLTDSLLASSRTPPFKGLVEELVAGQLDAAQNAWDDIVISLSPGAIGSAVILPAHHCIERASGKTTGTSPSLDRARAFLLRKATVLLDHASPDTGQISFCILTSGTQKDAVPATVLATTLARAGFQVNTPFLNAASLDSVDALQDLRPDHAIFVGGSVDAAHTVTRLFPGQRIYRWSPGSSTTRSNAPIHCQLRSPRWKRFFSRITDTDCIPPPPRAHSQQT